MLQTINEQCNEIVQKFKDNNALTKETAKTLQEMNIIANDYEIMLFKFMKSSWYLKKVNKTRYYLDEKAWNNPTKTYFKKLLILFSIIFPAMLLLVAILVVLKEFGII